jgi:cytochrome c biogenesis factor
MKPKTNKNRNKKRELYRPVLVHKKERLYNLLAVIVSTLFILLFEYIQYSILISLGYFTYIFSLFCVFLVAVLGLYYLASVKIRFKKVKKQEGDEL